MSVLVTHGYFRALQNHTQMCKFMSKNLKFPLERRADGQGKLVRRCNIKSVTFHALPDTEIYTTEYIKVFLDISEESDCRMIN